MGRARRPDPPQPAPAQRSPSRTKAASHPRHRHGRRHQDPLPWRARPGQLHAAPLYSTCAQRRALARPALCRRQAVHRQSRKSTAGCPRSAGHGARPEEADAVMSTAAPSRTCSAVSSCRKSAGASPPFADRVGLHAPPPPDEIRPHPFTSNRGEQFPATLLSSSSYSASRPSS
jgi:hypothetical protein